MTTAQSPDAPATLVFSNPAFLAGRRVFRGTRVPVEVLFENPADGLSLDEILDTHEALNRDDVVAVLAFAAQVVAGPKVA